MDKHNNQDKDTSTEIVESSTISECETPSKKIKIEDLKSNGTPKTPKTKIKKEVRNRCKFRIVRKGRDCNQYVKVNKTFCVEHSYMDKEAPEGRKRVLCPLDNKHSCFEDKLVSHLRKCNARDPDAAPGFVKGINLGHDFTNEDRITLREADIEDVHAVIEKVKKVYTEEKLSDIMKKIKTHNVLENSIKVDTYGSVQLRHAKQQSSLLGNMQVLGLLTDKKCYMEFGAGKGGLSHWLQKCTEDCVDTKFVLVDRGSNRYKKDGHHREQGPAFERIKMDIADLDLSNHEILKENTRPIVAIGKHLCGVATDLMLRCLINFTKDSDTGDKLKDANVAGIVVALCCHHECDWQSYTGQSSMLKWGFSAREFFMMRCMSSWAVCGSPEDNEHPAPTETKINRFSDIKAADRKEIGLMIKAIINQGRVNYLKENGFEASALIYTETTYSLENIALIAKEL